jgi:hypothetical protein
MKIGYYCESPADQAAMAVFAEGIFAEPPEPINMDLSAHGVGTVLSTLERIFIDSAFPAGFGLMSEQIKSWKTS